MGFIKRLLSLKRFKSLKYRVKHSQSTQYIDSGIPTTIRVEPAQEREAAAAKLLRSSSTHFSVVSEVDYSSLPPIRAYYIAKCYSLLLTNGSNSASDQHPREIAHYISYALA